MKYKNTQKIDKVVMIMNNVINADIKERKRTRLLSDARAVCFAYLYKDKEVKIQELADYFKMNHATVLHGLKNFKNFHQSDVFFKKIHQKFIDEIYVQLQEKI